MKLARIPECPLCGDDADKGKVVKNEIALVVCNCGMTYQQTYMTQEENKNFYKDKYRENVPPYKKDVDEENIIQEEKRGKRNAYILSSFGIRPKRHLDVGCSSGTFLNIMNEIYDCASLGVEPYDLFRKYSFSNGVNVVEDISQVKGKYDLITLVHVLEHLLNPLEMLSNIKDLLGDRGYFFVQVPFFLLCKTHPLLFLDGVLEKMLNKANFKTIKAGRIQGDIWAMATHSN